MKPNYTIPKPDVIEKKYHTGWLPPIPDLRDYTPSTNEIKLLSKNLLTGSDKPLPASIDLRQWCSPVENQANLGSCTSHAAIGIVEYYQRRAFNKHIEGSRLFLYKTTRNLMQVKGDTGAYIREVMAALVLCGIPDEKYWPYKVIDFDKEPDPFIYALADNYKAIKYFCHDPLSANLTGRDVLSSVKEHLVSGIPSIFGFWGFSSFENSDLPGGIPYPGPGESAQWGHAIVAVGYDDEKKITNLKSKKTTNGALLIRNSWGEEWSVKTKH